ncbi:MAG: translation initiation factor IF-2, partial [Lachnospiraceae bacterium]|nr:translation initiation factor IF-2 [Candidatus Equihabitans merdae]
MAKIRVHQLAKELGIDKREVAEYLLGKGYKGITAVSNVPDHEIDILRTQYGKAQAKPAENQAAEKPVQTAAEKTADAEDKPKKKTIVRVFREQNATEKLQTRKVKKPAPAPVKEEKPAAEKAAAPVKEAPVKETPAKEAPVKEAPAKAAAVEEKKAPAPAKQEKVEAAPVKETPAPAAKAEKAPEKKAAETAAVKEAPAKQSNDRRSQDDNRKDRPRNQHQGQNRDGGRDGGRQGGFRQGQNRDHAQNNGRPSGNHRPSGEASDGRRDNRDGKKNIIRTPRTDRNAQGGRPFGGDNRGRGASAVAAAPTDSSLAKKTTRDYRDNKRHDKERDERRKGQEGFGARKDGRQFQKVPKALQAQRPKETPKKEEKVTEITCPERITIRELAERMKIQATVIVKNLFMKGEMVTVNHEVTFDKATDIAMEYDILVEPEEKEDVIGALLAEEEDDEKLMVSRPPVVCVMGHVDHGKTSLLDAIRNTHVTDREAGGITQHIGAYMVSVKGQKITFLDTPGHEAFTAMRMRGASSTDIAVLVVAADDGVMPQTVEAINHAKAAGVEIIVAINKIDKVGANIDRVKQELSQYELIPTDWGGSTEFCPVSAKTQEGLDDLLDIIQLTAEVNELKANPNRKARGLVLEAKLDKGRGPVATILIQKGTLRQGDFIACGSAYGKVRAMTDEKGKNLSKATPSMPVEIIGLSSVPSAGEVLVALKTDKEAKQF